MYLKYKHSNNVHIIIKASVHDNTVHYMQLVSF